MARFLELYVHHPLETLMIEAPEALPELKLRMESDKIIMEIGAEYLVIQRNVSEKIMADEEELPEDVDESGPIP